MNIQFGALTFANCSAGKRWERPCHASIRVYNAFTFISINLAISLINFNWRLRSIGAYVTRNRQLSKLQSRFIWQIIKCIGITEFYNLILLRNPNGVIKAFICLFRYCLGFFLVYLHSFLPFFVFGCAVQIVKPQQFISNPDNCIINGRRLEATHAVDNSLVCAPGIGRIPGSLCGRVVCRLKGLAVGSPAIPFGSLFSGG